MGWWLIASGMVPLFPMFLRFCFLPHSFLYGPEYVCIDNCSCVMAVLLEVRPRLVRLEHLDVIAESGDVGPPGRKVAQRASPKRHPETKIKSYRMRLGLWTRGIGILPPLRPVPQSSTGEPRTKIFDLSEFAPPHAFCVSQGG